MLNYGDKPKTHLSHADPYSSSYNVDREVKDFDRAMYQGAYRDDGLIFYKLPQDLKEYRTKCCNAHDSFWGDVHICRKCEMENPEMIEVENVD